MGWINKIKYTIALFALPLLVMACSISYKFNGSSINYDKVKTISIETFPIKSAYVYAPLGTVFNDELRNIFIRQTWHSKGILDTVKLLKKELPQVDVIAEMLQQQRELWRLLKLELMG